MGTAINQILKSYNTLILILADNKISLSRSLHILIFFITTADNIQNKYQTNKKLLYTSISNFIEKLNSFQMLCVAHH